MRSNRRNEKQNKTNDILIKRDICSICLKKEADFYRFIYRINGYLEFSYKVIPYCYDCYRISLPSAKVISNSSITINTTVKAGNSVNNE